MKFRDIAKTNWKKFQDVLADSMASSRDTFDRVERSGTPQNIDEAAMKLADNSFVLKKRETTILCRTVILPY